MKPVESGTVSAALEAELKLADLVGRLIHFWGFKRPLGRVWAILYLSPEALSAAQLGERLHMSAGALSMALGELEKWGCIHRSWVPGERREFYMAESSIWKMVQRVLRERELSLVADFTSALESTLATLEQSQRAEPIPLRPTQSFKRERVSHLLELARTGEFLLRSLVSGSSVDPTLFASRSSELGKHLGAENDRSA